jgi:hypothetical protein
MRAPASYNVDMEAIALPSALKKRLRQAYIPRVPASEKPDDRRAADA